MRRPPRWKITAAAVLLPLLVTASILGSGTANAASQPVTIQNFSFQPGTVTITQGTTVVWTNQDSATHTATSDTGAWNTGDIAQGQSASVTFDQAGTFTYHCAIHPFMKGQIVVQAAATPAATSTTAPGAAATATPPPPTATSIPLTATPVGPAALHLGPAHSSSQVTWLGYYDGHKDAYIATDVTNKAQARAFHANFAPVLVHSGSGALSPMYFVTGRTAAGQIAVFGSEPGESDYSPLWTEIMVTWKAGVKPQLLVRDDQINNLAKQGKLTTRVTKIILNAPIIPGKG